MAKIERTSRSMLTILTVDDAQPIRLLLRTVLQALPDVKVIQCEGGHEALRELSGRPIDIVITDWNMPDMSGIDLTRAIRSGNRVQDRFVPIIMLTGHADRENVVLARDAGVDEFLVKPIRPSALYLRLDAVIQNRREFVVSQHYFGPDRRRKDIPVPGPDRRLTSPETEFLD